MNSFDIKKRALTREEVDLFAFEIKESPFTTGYSKKEWVNLKNIFVAKCSDELSGFCVCDEVVQGWIEVGLIFVREKFRRIGLGEQLVQMAIKDAEKRSKNIFFVTRNEIAASRFKKYGLQRVKVYDFPLALIMQQLLFTLKPYRLKESIKKLFLGRAKGVPVFGIKKV